MASHLNSSWSIIECLKSQSNFTIYMSFFAVFLLLLPLYIFIYRWGFLRWKSRQPISHSDHFTFHATALEFLYTGLCIVYILTLYFKQFVIMKYSLMIFSPIWSAKVHFNSLTCVERYLAVVHPITYLSLKKRGGVMLRNVSISGVWVACVVWAACAALPGPFHVALFVTSFSLGMITVFFCSVSVLCVLVRPGPAKARVKVDQSKKKAFQTVSIILVMLTLTTVGMLICEFFSWVVGFSDKTKCTILASAIWFGFPMSLVQPLLFLHRFSHVGKGKTKPAP